MDIVYYYPVQPVPYGSCGLFACGGILVDGINELGANSNLNRTFGIVDTTCADILGEVSCPALF